tara:strand:+ start:314 stop:2428 length:2115 start_codon:yes stop_codon:yes gene_type:complete
MLTNLSLKNIKSFNKEATLKIAPITLIYGANSTGKSTLWKFLTTLKSSLARGSGRNFINFSRSYDFANSKTISFDPNKESVFSFEFSNLSEPTFFDTHMEIVKNEDGTSTFRNKNQPSDVKGIRYSFSFLNENFNELDEENDSFKKLDEILKNINSKKSISSDDEELIKSISSFKEITKKKIKAEKEMLTAKKELSSRNKEQSVFLNQLKVFKNEKCFAVYDIFALSETPSRRIMGQSSLKRGYENKKKAELEIMEILKKNFKDKFEFDVGIQSHGPEWDAKGNVEYPSRIFRFDFIGPNGPHELQINEENNMSFLFIPVEISEDKSFWEEHFNILQHMKKLINNNTLNKDKKSLGITESKIYETYINKSFLMKENYLGSTKGIDSTKIPSIMNTWNKTLEAMCTSSLDDFIKIMSEDLRTCILSGSSFIPNKYFYGGDIYRAIFDDLATDFVDGFVETEGDISNEGTVFLNDYSLFSKTSYDDQFKNLFKFSRELKKFRENSSSSERLGMGMGMRFHPRVISGMLHDDPNHKEQLIKLLEKINLPFNIDSQSNEDGEVKLSFSNKRISKTQKDIPLEQSGNGLQSVMLILTELIKSVNHTIIIEEPENKIHPNIQGNLIELITEIIKANSSNVIIETHSEHFILRIQKLIRDAKIKPDLVSINYVYLDENGEGSKIDHMPLNEKGKFIKKWRHGFFNERLNEL